MGSGDVEELEAERRRLIGIAFRLLGTVAEAEDAVQEAFVRWLRLGPDERALIREPVAWLTTVTTRICLDLLGSARARREQYVGPWLPEPVPGGDLSYAGAQDPAARAELVDSVSTAVLLLMERMTPAERASFVLHDVFGHSFAEVGAVLGRSAGAARELASSARRRLAREPRQAVDRRTHTDAVAAFLEACEGGDLVRLVSLLDPAVVLTSDGGGVARAALNPIVGPDRVARFVLGVRRRRPDVRLAAGRTGDGAAILFVGRDDARVSGVLNLRVAGGRVRDVWIQWNPRKLGLWSAA